MEQEKIIKPKKKHAGGRPRKYNSPKQMQKAIDEYFAKQDQTITICGLALALGFISRQSFLDYSGYSKEFSDTIKHGKCRVEEYYEQHLVKNNAAGSIFALKNFNWKDKTEQVHGVTKEFADIYKDICGNGKAITISGD